MAALDYPGHGRRFGEPLLTDMHVLVEDALHQIQDRLSQPYAFWGHSFGAGIAWLLARRLAATGCTLPVHLFVSGRRGPSLENNSSERHLLPTSEFLKMVFEFDGTPKELLQNPELLELFEPVLRADFQANDTWRYQPHHTPLEVPVTVMAGTIHDVAPEAAQAWRKETTQPLKMLNFEGNHFFIFQHVGQICSVIERTLRQTMRNNHDLK